MKLDCFEEVKRLTSEMVAIPSINKEPHGETAVARYVYNYFMDLPYFKAHPEQVMCFQTKDDFVERHSTLAYVKGTKGTSNRTVILIGHIDTVGVDDFGTIREYAFKTDELPQKLKETFSLTPEVLADIESGDYMFGRGALDMKSGVAGHMYLVKYFSEHPEELDGNLVQIAECDEEDNSHGIITAIDYLLDLKKKEHFEYVACINADYSTNYMPGDENRYIYYGSIGKLLPCFVALGKESHVGSAFNAFDPNLLIAEVTRRMSLNTDLCDIAQGEVTIPPISLKQADTKDGYTVQTALTAFSYYNFFTHGMSPDVVLEKSRQVGVDAFDSVVAYLNEQYEKYCSLSGVPGDENRYIYYGSIGKLLPCFVALGKESHVGSAFNAFDPNLLIAEVTRRMSLNTDLCDIAQGEVTIPPISLKQADTKDGYTVQTALTAFSYYNFFTHGMSPDVVLEKSRQVGVDAFDSVVAYLNEQYEKYCSLSGVPYTKLPWKTRVYTWKEFYNEAAERHGQPFKDAIAAFAENLQREQPAMDLRYFSLAVVEEVWKWYEDKSPALVLFFGSVFSARIEMTGKTEKERALLDAVEGAVEKLRPEAQRQIKTRMFYPYISDSSFMALCDTRESFDAVAENMPSWKVKYFHDVDKILEINVPVVNIGAFGRDGHMLTERVDMLQTFRNVPNISYEAIVSMLS